MQMHFFNNFVNAKISMFDKAIFLHCFLKKQKVNSKNSKKIRKFMFLIHSYQKIIITEEKR